MKDNRKLIAIAVALVVVLVGALALYNGIGDKTSYDNLAVTKPENESDETENGGEDGNSDLAPDFTVIDTEGNSVKLSDMRGKPVIVNFWASWCGPCKGEMPDFEEKYKEYGDEINFMMINLTDGSGDTVKSASEFIESRGYSFPIYFDTMMEAAMAYSVYSIPVTFFIDAQGSVAAYAPGAIDGDTIQQGIDMIYQGN